MSIKLVAELGINHNGDVNLAHKMIDSAKENGADIVKFQVHIADKEMINDLHKHVKIGHELYPIIQQTSLNFDEFVALKKHTNSVGLEFLATPFSLEAVDWLERLEVDSYKIGSGECSDFMLLNRVIKTKKKMIISTGMSTEKEIEDMVNFVKDKSADFILLHCTSAYPCPFDKVRLGQIPYYKNKFNCEVGFSDHSPGTLASIASIALGTSLIEKHFTIDRSLPGPDQSSSIIPSELKQIKEAIDVITLCMQNNPLSLTDVRQLFMHGITATHDMPTGSIITEQDITSKRPLVGIPSFEFEKIIGMKTINEIKCDAQLKWEDIRNVTDYLDKTFLESFL